MDIEVSQLKLELKQWELNFFKKQRRKPGKDDVANHPDIKAKYKKFALLKKGHAVDKNCLSTRNILAQKNVGKTGSEQMKDGVLTVSETDGGVWGSNLLRKNSTVDENSFIESKKRSSQENRENIKTKKCNWSLKMRRNVGSQAPLKNLQNRLREKGRNKSPAANCFQTLEGSNDVSCSVTEMSNFSPLPDTQCKASADITPVFGSQVKVVSKIVPVNPTLSHENRQHTSFFSSPFSPKAMKKHGLLTKSLATDLFQQEDLSDLQNITQTTDSSDNTEHVTHSVRCSENMVKSNFIKADQEKRAPLQDDTESYIETNFRNHTKNDRKVLNSEEYPAFKYEDVCLSIENRESGETVFPKSEDEEQDKMAAVASEKLLISSRSSNISKSLGRKIVRENYVMLNMKKKRFSKKGGSGQFLRKQIVRQKMAKKGYTYKSGWRGRSGGARSTGAGSWGTALKDKGGDKCFKCGGIGHWASKCDGQGYQQKISSTEDEARAKESLEEILENVDLIAGALKGETSCDFLQQKIAVTTSDPLIELDDEYPLADNKDVMAALKMFKYSSFRPGQEKAICRILKGLPTLLVLSTGSGKSLCYQLPAYLYATKMNAITLVVSPLVSLMDDQIRGLPRMMKAARIHSGMTKEQRDKTMSAVESRKIHVLLVSPEAITSWAGMSPKYSPLSKLPPIAFACVDECHCLSEWSHAFRPSYLRVCQVLKNQLGVKCLVGLTATATMDTCASVAKQLGISDPTEGVIVNIDIPENLVLSVSKDRYKDEALADLLLGDRFSKLDSVIVYCTRRDEAARIASLLRIKMMDMPALQNPDQEDEENTQNEVICSRKRKRGNSKHNSKKKVVTLDAECYHAGLSASERRRIQTKFMNGSLRVVVATVAFGMGIDKQDVRSVIHYNMPMSFERYVQEVGRAGRDGEPAHCHVFLDSDGEDLNELSRHCYAKSIDRYVIKKFVKKVFPPCCCNHESNECNGHFSTIPIDSAIEEMDVKREGLETLLCYLEIESLVKVFLPTETHCTIQFYGGPGQMVKTAKKVQAVALALKLAGTKSDDTEVGFNAMKLADELGMELPVLKKMLRCLIYDTTLSSSGSEVGKSGIEVKFSQLSFCVQSRQKATDDFLDSVTDLLHKRVIAQENKEVNQLNMCFNTLKKFAHCNVGTCRDSTDETQGRLLKDIITNYFKDIHPVQDTEKYVVSIDANAENDLRSLIKQFLLIYGNDLSGKITGRAIARIFHGIDSPLYSAKVWGTVRRFWRSRLHIDFNLIRRIATEEIILSRR